MVTANTVQPVNPMTADAHRFGLLRGSQCWMAVATVLMIAILVSPAAAQTCAADSQCANNGRSVASCVGDTLIIKRSICSGGCSDVEERRHDCGSRISGTITCSGTIAIRSEGGCNATLASCNNRTDREVCVPTCSCRGNRLTVATGTCTPGAGCARVTMQCKTGCTCQPEPRCT